MVRPNSIGDDLSWEPKSLKAGHVGRYFHPQTIPMSDQKINLAMPLGDIPPGSRFEAAATGAPGGVLRRPDASDVVTVWQSLGEVIEITHPDGTVTLHGWQEVDAALGGGAQ